jgi:mono/diheme cytochrome c family protein
MASRVFVKPSKAKREIVHSRFQAVPPGYPNPRDGARADRLTCRVASSGLAVGCAALGAAFLTLAAPAGRAHAQDVQRGAQSYAAHCARCHGARGADAPHSPIGTPGHSLADCHWMRMMSDATLFGIIRNGASWAGIEGMPAVSPSVSDSDIRAIVSFIRSFCTQSQP